MDSMPILDCEECGRPFFISSFGPDDPTGRSPIILEGRCLKHCTSACCREVDCIMARLVAPKTIKPCIVCRRPRAMFERFAPCSNQCRKMHYRSTRRYICIDHEPTAKSRIHSAYCSLRCYNSWEYGHRERALGGRRVRRWRHRDEYNARRRLAKGK